MLETTTFAVNETYAPPATTIQASNETQTSGSATPAPTVTTTQPTETVAQTLAPTAAPPSAPTTESAWTIPAAPLPTPTRTAIFDSLALPLGWNLEEVIYLFISVQLLS